jgi:uncharacterized protein
MTTHSPGITTNLQRVREAYDAFARGDVPAVLALLDPSIEWTEATGFPYGGTYRGPQAVLEGVFMRLGGEWDGFTVAPDAFHDAGDTIVARGWYSGAFRATGKTFRARFAHVWTLRNGQAVEFEQFADTAKVREAVTV